MINDESYKLSDVKKYVPPEQLMGNKLLSATNTNTGSDSELSIFGNNKQAGKSWAEIQI